MVSFLQGFNIAYFSLNIFARFGKIAPSRSQSKGE
nr:MAG TPA: hypothetical protein [Caudoviricetes sp.]